MATSLAHGPTTSPSPLSPSTVAVLGVSRPMRGRGRALILCLMARPVIADEPPLSPVSLGRIDAHVHFFAEAKPVLEVLDRLNVTGVNICVVDRYDPGYETAPPQHEMARRLARASGGRLPWIAALDDGT